MTSRVAILLFDDVDILDFTGPLEVLLHLFRNNDLQKREAVFETCIIGNKPTIRANKALTIAPDLTPDEAAKKIEDFDVVVVPGGPPPALQALIDGNDPIVQFISKFTHQAPKSGGDKRILLSVCTGALFLAATGALKGLKVTTHNQALDLLRQMEPTAQVISHMTDTSVGRCVDGGNNAEGIRIVTAGGVSCGLDATLFVGELVAGKEVAEFTARFIEHEWKRA